MRQFSLLTLFDHYPNDCSETQYYKNFFDEPELNFAPRLDEVSQLVFNAQPSNVERVFVDGRVLKEPGKLVGVDVKTVMADANRAAQRMRAALNRE